MTEPGSVPYRTSFDPDDADATRAASSTSGEGQRSPSGARFAPGMRLADRYRLLALLGRGGMGEVYAADDEELGIPVALKVLHLGIGTPGDGLMQLKREVLLARSVAHPHVCRVYDLGRHLGGDAPVWFLTMELLNGQTLRQRLTAANRLPVPEALAITEHIAAGLGSAHRAGVVHRDLKSSNVMLVASAGGERAVITDFGLARESGADDRKERAGGWVGSPAYMAPEQVRGEEAGPAADIYALGVVLFEMTAGRLPFLAPSAAEMARMRLTAPPPSPRAAGADIDERWEAVILRCLAPDPAHRFARAEDVAEALGESGPVAVTEAPALHPAAKLPTEQDAFIGRDQELDALAERMAAGARLVTLMGAAGMGKTRLAVRYGWQSRDQWPGGIWFADLTAARLATDLASAVARSFGVVLGKMPPIDQLGHAIAARGRCLVVLDNFEQIAELAPETVGAWLDRAPEARFLVTSRERLDLKTEETLLIEPLSLDAGVALFADRARRQRPDFALDAAVKPAVTEIVRWAEGMPLAIELVAARTRVMSAMELAARLRDRFRLAGGSGSGRHATLRAALDGSWELLRPEEKSVLAQCAVFEGGFTLEAVEHVVSLSAWDEAPWVVDVVQSLVDKSLVRARITAVTPSAEAPEVRFGMYASIQEYAREKLDAVAAEAPDAAIAAELRHGQWYARYGTDVWVESIERQAGGEQRRVLRSELLNLVAACRRATARGDGATAAATYRAVWAVADLRGPYAPAVDLGLEVLDAPLDPLEHGLVLSTLGMAEWRLGRMEEARTHLEAALAIHREHGDRRAEAGDLRALGVLHFFQGRVDEARSHYEAALAIQREVGDRNAEGILLCNLATLFQGISRADQALTMGTESLAIAREVGNRRAESIALVNVATVHQVQGRLPEALANYEAALVVQRELGDRAGEGTALGNLAILHLAQGRMAAARQHCEASLQIFRELGDRRLEGSVLGHLGHLHEEEGRSDEARACYERALAIQREVGNRHLEGILLGALGEHCRRQGQLAEARRHLETGIALQREVGDRRFWGGLLGSLASVEAADGRFQEAEAAIARGEALVRETGDRLGLAYLLCHRVEVEERSGKARAARATLEEAAALAAELGSGPDSDLSRQLARLRLRLRS